MHKSQADVSAETEELAKFREQWLEEVRGKQKAQDASGTLPAVPSSSTSAEEPAHPEPTPAHTPVVRRTSHGAPSSSTLTRTTGTASAVAQLGPVLQRAVEVYRKAVHHEQRSELDEALRLYRTAFRIDPNVDRAYHLMEEEVQRKAAGAAPPQHKAHHPKAGSNASTVDSLLPELQALDLVSGPARVPVAHATGDGFVTGALASLVASWPVDLAFEAENESEGIPIKTLPDEVLMLVLALLDHTAVERFARVNRKARVITLDASIWRRKVQKIYRPPQISNDEELDALLLKYMTDYRRIYVEHPRVRYDGVYIAVCHYIRNGIGENVWVSYNHLITYYRYLRFYPDGQVLSLLANEELAPGHAISLLKPSLRMKGFFIGTWYLDGTEVHIDDLIEPITEHTRYSFQMVLELRSKPVGRWNRLDFRAYDSVHIGSGEATPLGLKNERPFWFSKVRSYA